MKNVEDIKYRGEKGERKGETGEQGDHKCAKCEAASETCEVGAGTTREGLCERCPNQQGESYICGEA